MIALPPHPERLRSRRHLARLRLLPCCIPGCRGWPVDAHHLTHAQPRARGLRVGDQYATPLCRWTHHSATSRAGVHASGNEAAWWRAHNLDPLPIAARLWAESEGP